VRYVVEIGADLVVLENQKAALESPRFVIGTTAQNYRLTKS
jgi:hypothetical protein